MLIARCSVRWAAELARYRGRSGQAAPEPIQEDPHLRGCGSSAGGSDRRRSGDLSIFSL